MCEFPVGRLAVSSSGRASYGGVYCGGGATRATDRNVFTVANMPVGHARVRGGGRRDVTTDPRSSSTTSVCRHHLQSRFGITSSANSVTGANTTRPSGSNTFHVAATGLQSPEANGRAMKKNVPNCVPSPSLK